jgi:hypothetical protein
VLLLLLLLPNPNSENYLHLPKPSPNCAITMLDGSTMTGPCYNAMTAPLCADNGDIKLPFGEQWCWSMKQLLQFNFIHIRYAIIVAARLQVQACGHWQNTFSLSFSLINITKM